MMCANACDAGSVECHLGADPDTRDHEAHLVHDRIRQDAPHVVLEQRVDDPIEHHVQADRHQCSGTRETHEERIDRRLGGVRREEDHAGRARLRVGVGDPGRERRGSGVDQEAREDEPARDPLRRERFEGDRARTRDVRGEARHQHHATEQVNQQVAHARIPGAGLVGRPDDGGRCHRHELPEHEERDDVSGQRDADCASGVDERCGQLERACPREREEARRERRDREDRREEPAGHGAAHRSQLPAEERERRGPAHGHGPHERQGRERQGQHGEPASAPTEQREQEPAGDQDQARRHATHSSGRCASEPSRAPWPQARAPRTRGSRTLRRNRRSPRRRSPRAAR